MNLRVNSTFDCSLEDFTTMFNKFEDEKHESILD